MSIHHTELTMSDTINTPTKAQQDYLDWYAGEQAKGFSISSVAFSD